MERVVLDTREVLLGHLLAKITYLCCSKQLAKQILQEVSYNLSNKNILLLLQNDEALSQAVIKSQAYNNEKQELGEQLFEKVANFESDLCAQITGMLLELDTKVIHKILNDDKLLSEAIEKSRREFLEYTEKKKIREELGEKLYEKVSELYTADVASRLTGMLLELDENVISKLLEDSSELKIKLETAYKALCSYYSKQG